MVTLQALGVQGLLVDVEQVQQFLGHLPLDQPVRPGGLVLRAGLLGRHRRRELLGGTILRCQRADVDHAVEHPTPPFRRTFSVDGGVKAGRPLDERGQQRAL